jgi:hypothetical protein
MLTISELVGRISHPPSLPPAGFARAPKPVSGIGAVVCAVVGGAVDVVVEGGLDVEGCVEGAVVGGLDVVGVEEEVSLPQLTRVMLITRMSVKASKISFFTVLLSFLSLHDPSACIKLLTRSHITPFIRPALTNNYQVIWHFFTLI